MKPTRVLSIVVFVIVVIVVGQPRIARSDPAPEQRTLVVGTLPIPPFIIKQPDGKWTGISIDLLQRAAAKLHAKLDIRQLPLAELIEGSNVAIDITASINVTENTDTKFELTHAFYSTGLAIAVREAKRESKWTVVGRLFSGPFMWLIGGTILLLGLVGVLMWWVEKRPAKPTTGDKQALTKSLFWAFEPVIGYKASQHATWAGRLIGTVWGLFGLVFVTSLTANLSAQLTAHQLAPEVRGPDDLVRVKVGTVRESSALKFCERRGLRRSVYDDPEQALAALDRGDVTAVVYEAPVIAYQVQSAHKGLKVLPGTFANHGYAFGLRHDSPIRRELNHALLEITAGEEWSSLLASYFGQSE